MKTIQTLSFAAIVMAAACGGSKPAAKTGGDTAGAKTEAVLGIGELKIYMGAKMGVQMHRDGKLEVMVTKNGVESWEGGITFAADGTVTGKDGKTGHVHADGTIEASDGEVLKLAFDGDAAVIAGKRVTVDDKGMFVVDGKAGEMRVEGANDTLTKRTALVIMAMMMEYRKSASTASP
jgi:hypothetical protein